MTDVWFPFFTGLGTSWVEWEVVVLDEAREAVLVIKAHALGRQVT
jgi:hypothetical protein